MTQAPPGTTGQRFTLIVLCMVFLAPVVAAWIVFNFTDVGHGQAGASHGDLIQPPRPVGDLVLSGPGRPGQEYHLHGKWSIALLVETECDTGCERILDTVRRIRLALGADAVRVQQVLFMAEGASPGMSVTQSAAFPDQLIAHVSDPVIRRFKLTESERPLHLRRLYIIDPRGYLMMSYPEPADASGMIKDLKRLLKYSRTG